MSPSPQCPASRSHALLAGYPTTHWFVCHIVHSTRYSASLCFMVFECDAWQGSRPTCTDFCTLLMVLLRRVQHEHAANAVSSAPSPRPAAEVLTAFGVTVLRLVNVELDSAVAFVNECGYVVWTCCTSYGGTRDSAPWRGCAPGSSGSPCCPFSPTLVHCYLHVSVAPYTAVSKLGPPTPDCLRCSAGIWVVGRRAAHSSTCAPACSRV